MALATFFYAWKHFDSALTPWLRFHCMKFWSWTCEVHHKWFHFCPTAVVLQSQTCATKACHVICRPVSVLMQTAAVLMTGRIQTRLSPLNFKDPPEEVVTVWESVLHSLGRFSSRSGGLKQPDKFSTNPRAFYLGHNGSTYRQDVATHHQQFGVPARSQCGRQEGLPHGGHGLFLHNVLHSGKWMGAFINVYWIVEFF